MQTWEFDQQWGYKVVAREIVLVVSRCLFDSRIDSNDAQRGAVVCSWLFLLVSCVLSSLCFSCTLWLTNIPMQNYHVQ